MDYEFLAVLNIARPCASPRCKGFRSEPDLSPAPVTKDKIMFQKDRAKDPVSPYRRAKFDFEDVDKLEPPAAIKNDPVRLAHWRGEEVFPDEIFSSVHAEEIAAAEPTEPPDTTDVSPEGLSDL